MIGLLGLLVLTNGVFSSCSSDDSSPKVEEEQQTEIAIKNAKGTYLGTEAAKGKFAIQLKSDDTDFELSLISDLIADKDLLEAELKSTKYSVSESGDLYTIANTSYLKKGDAQLKITKGDLDVSQTDGKYSIKGLLTDEQNIVYQINYNGLIDIEPIYETVYEIQNGWFWGDDMYDYPNVGEYMSFFTQGDYDKYGELKEDGDGYHILLSFFDVMAPKQWEGNIKIPNKMYRASTKNEIGTFHVGSKEEIESGAPTFSFAKYLHNNTKEGVKQEMFIMDGAILTMDNEKGQEVRFNLELQDGSRHLGKYVGKVRQGDEYTISTLKSDKTVGTLDYGYLEYKGKSPVAGKENNRWEVYLFNENLTTMPEYYWYTEGSGEYMRLSIYTALDATTDIPVGVYPIGEEKVGTASTGGGTEVGLDFGTWYYQLQNDDFIHAAPTRSGTVTVAKVGDNYSIKVNVVDDRENKITATYNGALSFQNGERRNAAKKPNTATKNKWTSGKGKIYSKAKNNKLNK
ncbi:hypothetical protein [Flavobacterium sp. JP2137]|uniref:hypothetical protein n=1 Tax=Flavobacterium sp. JP2137 TaxID=3414510 RepID=UPI003D2FFD7B